MDVTKAHYSPIAKSNNSLKYFQLLISSPRLGYCTHKNIRISCFSPTSFPEPLCCEACGGQRPWQRLVVTWPNFPIYLENLLQKLSTQEVARKIFQLYWPTIQPAFSMAFYSTSRSTTEALGTRLFSPLSGCDWSKIVPPKYRIQILEFQAWHETFVRQEFIEVFP